MEPGDVDVRPLSTSNVEGLDDLEPNYSEGFIIAFVDGAIWFIRKDVPHEAIAPFLTLEGARSHDRDKELSPYAIDKLPPLQKHDGKYVVESTE
jgi:hypothetical protein